MSDMIDAPKHYKMFGSVSDMEAIEIIAATATVEQFKGFCMLTSLKYRLRVGKKDDVAQELGKSDKYLELFDQFKHLCSDYAKFKAQSLLAPLAPPPTVEYIKKTRDPVRVVHWDGVTTNLTRKEMVTFIMTNTASRASGLSWACYGLLKAFEDYTKGTARNVKSADEFLVRSTKVTFHTVTIKP